jgi:hypothetical protein
MLNNRNLAGSHVQVINISDYTTMFGVADEREFYHRTPEISTLVWTLSAFALFVAVLSTGMLVALWVYFDHVIAAYAKHVMLPPVSFRVTSSKFSITVDKAWGLKLTFLEGPLQGHATSAYLVAGKVILTSEIDCYAAYPELIEHIQLCRR